MKLNKIAHFQNVQIVANRNEEKKGEKRDRELVEAETGIK